jgi:photosystem II stability/assembly factor-like uncharacterized protein
MHRRFTLALLGLVSCTSAPPVPAPARIARTEQASGTTALLIAVSPVNERVVWVSGTQGTWLRTVDGGAHWQAGRVPGADSLQFRDVHAVDERTAYLLSIGNGAQSRIYRTADAGATWQLLFTNPDPKAFLDCMDFWSPTQGIVVSDAVDGKAVVLGTRDGDSWARLEPTALPAAPDGEGSFAASGTCLVTRPGGHAWIAAADPTRSRVLRTSDFGATWRSDSLPLTTRAGSGVQSVAFHDASNGLALGGGTTAKPDDVNAAITADGGRTWTPVGRVPLASGVWGGVPVPGARATYVAVGPSGAAWTRDGGRSWTPLDSVNYWSVGFAARNAGWAVGQKGRITKFAGF